eukprot:907039-Pyramimonas_sp.AAC.1
MGAWLGLGRQPRPIGASVCLRAAPSSIASRVSGPLAPALSSDRSRLRFQLLGHAIGLARGRSEVLNRAGKQAVSEQRLPAQPVRVGLIRPLGPRKT